MQAQEKKNKIKEYPELPQGMILDNRNKPVLLVEFVQKLKDDRRLRSLYLCNNAMWQKFFEDNATALNLSENVDKKLNDLWQVSVFFTEKEWPALFVGIKKMEALLQ